MKKIILESNRKFDEIKDVRSYISRIDREWLAAPWGKTTPFMDKLINNPASKELREAFIEFYGNKYGYSVFVVKDGEEALDYLFAREIYEGRNVNHFPKLILLDLKLPKVDGLEVLRQIRSDERIRKVPVVVLTSSNEEQDIVESYTLGANSYIVKPVDFGKFTDTVSQIGMYWLLLNKSPA